MSTFFSKIKKWMVIKLIQNTIKNTLKNKGKVPHRNILKRNLVILPLASFLQALHFFSSTLTLFFTEWGGLNYTQMMLLQSYFMAMWFLFEVPTGTFADKFGRKKTMLMGYFFISMFPIVYTIKPAFWCFILGETLAALGMALISGAWEALLYDTLKELGREKQSKKYFGILNSTHLAGILIGAPIGSIMAKYIGLEVITRVSAIPPLVAVGFSLLLIEPSHFKKVESISAWKLFKQGLNQFKTNRSLINLSFEMVIPAIMGYYAVWTYQARLNQIGVAVEFFGLVNFGIVGLEILVMNSFALLDWIINSKKLQLRLLMALAALGYILAAISTNAIIVSIGFLLAGGIGWSRPVLISNYINKHTPSDKRATLLSTISMFRQGFLMLLNPFMGIWMESNLSLILLALGIIGSVWSVLSPTKEIDLLQ
jgi:MFS family permease